MVCKHSDLQLASPNVCWPLIVVICKIIVFILIQYNIQHRVTENVIVSPALISTASPPLIRGFNGNLITEVTRNNLPGVGTQHLSHSASPPMIIIPSRHHPILMYDQNLVIDVPADAYALNQHGADYKWGLWRRKQVSHAGIINYIPQ